MAASRKGGALLRTLREKAGLSLEALGVKVGYSQGMVGHLETGIRLPEDDDDHIRSLALACSAEDRAEELVAAFADDRAARWIINRPRHLTDDQVRRIRKIAIDEEQEPVAA